MNKLIVVSVFLLTIVGSYFIVGNILYKKPQDNLDARFDDVVNELEEYGGAMIVSYDAETGEIINKRKAGSPREAGVMSISEDAYDKNKEGWPEGTLAISRDMSPSQVIESGGSN